MQTSKTQPPLIDMPMLFYTDQPWNFDHFTAMDKTFYNIMKSKLGLSAWLSIQSIFMNTLLLTFLFSTPEFRSWQFFPLMMQATIDIVGPGFANLIYECKLFQYLPVLEGKVIKQVGYSPAFIRNSSTLLTLYGPLECLIMNLRCILNEYSTGFCLLATSFYRYVLVCHPTMTIGPKFYKSVAGILISILFLSVFGSISHLLFFKRYGDVGDIYINSYHYGSLYAPTVSKFVQEKNIFFSILSNFEKNTRKLTIVVTKNGTCIFRLFEHTNLEGQRSTKLSFSARFSMCEKNNNSRVFFSVFFQKCRTQVEGVHINISSDINLFDMY